MTRRSPVDIAPVVGVFRALAARSRAMRIRCEREAAGLD